MKHHFRNVSEGKRFSSNRNLQKIVKPFLTGKGFIASSDIPFKEGDEIRAADKELPETFKNHHVNILEKQLYQSLIRPFISFVIWTSILVFQKLKAPMQITLVAIIEMNKVTKNEPDFSFKEVGEVEILKLLKNIDV